MNQRMQQLLILLRRSHKVKFTIDYEVYEHLELGTQLKKLEKDIDLEITVIRVIDEMKISVELKK